MTAKFTRVWGNHKIRGGHPLGYPMRRVYFAHINTPLKMQTKVYNITYNIEAGLTMLALRKKEEI